MTQIKYIKEQYEKEEKSLREISRMTGYSFQTVRKYAYEDNWNAEHLPNVEPWKHPVLGPYIETIDRWLEEDLRAPRKQRHTAMRIHARLVEECGFTGNYSCVKLKSIYLVYLFQDFLNLSPFPFVRVTFLADFKIYKKILFLPFVFFVFFMKKNTFIFPVLLAFHNFPLYYIMCIMRILGFSGCG